MERKQIRINPDFFSLKRRKKNKSSAKKPILKHSLKTKDIKKDLLKRIKQHQQRSTEKKTEMTNQKIKAIESHVDLEFEKSVEYLNSIKKNQEQKKNEKKQELAKTRKKSLIRPDPPYGVLKTGKKPLYRDYMKKLKDNTPAIIIHDKKKKEPIDSNVLERQVKLATLKKKYKVRKRRYTLGKDLKNRKVGILIKNRTMKKGVQRNLQHLKNEPLHSVKKYLRKHGLIRIGTSAPESVVRNIYQDSKSAGDIYNKSADILLHNYLNKAI